MRKTIVFITLAVVAVSSGCKGGSNSLKRDQAQYDVVQEGSAAAAPSADLNPAAPTALTGTNADTTSAFTLQPGQVPTSSPGTLAGTLPQPSVYSGEQPRAARPARPATPPPPPPPAPAVEQRAAEPEPAAQEETTPEPAEVPEPPANDTQAPPPPPTNTR